MSVRSFSEGGKYENPICVHPSSPTGFDETSLSTSVVNYSNYNPFPTFEILSNNSKTETC